MDSGFATGNYKLGLYDSGRNKVAESIDASAANGVLHVALSATYDLTNQTYYLVFTDEDDTFFTFSTITGGNSNREGTFITDTSNPLPATLGDDGAFATGKEIIIWFTNTADGS